MPELPEVAAHAERLDGELGGETLARFEALSFTALKTFDPAPEAAVGSKLSAVRHRGKHLLLAFTDGHTVTFVVHLMQGGRLRPEQKPSRRPRGGLARWGFENGTSVLLTEAGTEHKAGVWVVAGDPLTQEPLADLGPDADTVDGVGLAELLAARSQRLHTFLRDQGALAGIGRRLANEICHRARLSPFARTDKLSADDIDQLHTAIRDSIAEGLAFERSLAAMSASADRPAAVHARASQPCPVCGDAVRAVEYRDYTVSYCPTCQTGGKILADNTTSKFLR